jgi:hypothetical protein
VTVSEERRKQLSRAGRIGGLRRWVKHPHSKDDFSAARQALADSFRAGHGCSLCGSFTEIPADATEADREAAAKRLRRTHYRNLSERAVAKRRAEG